jgi:hypothetical protein
MITLDVLSVGGKTNRADSTFPVTERNVYLGYVDPDNSNKSYVLYEVPGAKAPLMLHVNATVAAIVTALNAGSELKIFLAVTIKKIDKRPIKDGAGRASFINIKNIGIAYDDDSDGVIEYYGSEFSSYYFKLLQTNETISTISALAADISAGAETLVYPLTSKTVFGYGSFGPKAFPSPRTMLINETMIGDRLEGWANRINRQATGYVTMKLESVGVAAGGTGYTVADVLTGTTGTGTKFTLTVATVGGGGAITDVTKTTVGLYTVLPPSISAAPVSGGTGTGATFNIDFEVAGVVVTDGGEGYASGATMTFTGGGGGTGATATPVLSGSKIQSVTVVPGNNYTSIPALAISAPVAKDGWVFRNRHIKNRIYIV